MDDIMQYSKNENFKYFVIEASHGDYYGFNTKVKKEREIAENIVSEYDDFMVKGWKVSKKLPKWVENTNSWISFREIFLNASLNQTVLVVNLTDTSHFQMPHHKPTFLNASLITSQKPHSRCLTKWKVALISSLVIWSRSKSWPIQKLRHITLWLILYASLFLKC